MSGLGHRLRTVLEVLGGEGARAVAGRALDHLAERRRLARLDPDPTRPLPRVPVVNLSPLPPYPNRGGSLLQMVDRLAARAAFHPVALLCPERDAWRLEVFQGGGGTVRRRPAEGGRPAASAADVTAAARWAADLVGAAVVHVESLHGFPLAAVPALTTAGLRVILSIHDFTAHCRRPHLVELPGQVFCHYSRDDQRCRRCLAVDGGADDDPGRYRTAAAAALAAADRVVFPSAFLRDRHLELFPLALSPDRTLVVLPATHRHPAPAARPAAGRVALVGGIKPHKGGLLLADIAAAVRRRCPQASFWAYGEGDGDLVRALRRGERLRVRGYYRAGALASLLVRDRVAVAVFPPIWPESYGLVVDECLTAGVPVVTFAHGAAGERVARLGCGRSVDPTAGAAGLAAAVVELLEQPVTVPAAVLASLPTPAGMAAELERIYRDLVPV